MIVRRQYLYALALFSFLYGNSVGVGNEVDTAEVYYFFDDTNVVDQQSYKAIRAATESGLRIREIAAKRFPNLVKRFQIRKLPSLVLLRRSRLEDRHEGRFTFARIREMFAKARENRLARRERFREMLAGKGQVRRDDAPESVAPIAPRYIPTSSSSVANANIGTGKVVPKPLDRNGRFAVAHHASSGEKTAFDATVRIRVIDPSGTSHGTGTIIHSSGNDALVLTCGHIFRESRGRGRIEGDVCFSSQMKTCAGRIISYDSNAHDIALLTIRTPFPIQPAKIARTSYRGRTNEDVFTIGCDKGNQPTIRRSHFKRTASYDGTEKYDVYGRPIDGRSGGGLFNQKGELIGVCNAAAVHVDEGIYSGLKTIYRQLGVSHLAHLFKEDYWSNSQSSLASRSNEMPQRMVSSSSANENSGAVQFQDLPKDPALAFRGSTSGDQMRTHSSRSNGMVPVTTNRDLQTTGSNAPGELNARYLTNTSASNTAMRRPPRIPTFQSLERF